MNFVDTHTHVISPDTGEYPLSPIGGTRSRWSQERPVDAVGLLRALDAAGVERAVVVQASTVYGHDNRYMADSVRRHPDRLVGVYSVDALAPGAVDEIRRWQGQGLAGFRLFTTGTTMPGQSDWLGHPDSYPAWAFAEAEGIPVCLQMTMEGLPALRQVMNTFPRARVLLDHCARPDLSDGAPYSKARGLFELAEFPGVYLKLTHRAFEAASSGASTVKDFLDRVLGTYGASRTVWGSNFPAADGELSAMLAEARTKLSGLSEDEQASILGGTARFLYPQLKHRGGQDV